MNRIKTLANSSIHFAIASSVLLTIVSCGGGSTSSIEEENNTASNLDIVFTKTPPPEDYNVYAKFEFSAEDGVSYSCALNYNDFSPCESPITLMPLSVGAQTFSVKVSDAIGAEGIEGVYSWNTISVTEPNNTEPHHADLIPEPVYPDSADGLGWRGIFRVNCDFANSSYNDPIVFPGEEGAAHLHRFYGNTLVDHNTTDESLFTTGESTCQGNVLNLSAYWMPSVLAPSFDPQTGQRLLDASGQPAWKAVSGITGDADESHELFYYVAAVSDLESIQPIPLGMRIIAGSHMGQPGQEQNTSIVRWHCQSWDAADNDEVLLYTPGIPSCEAGDMVRQDIIFPSCWDGVNLDSANHKSHMAYPETIAPGETVCPASHPVALVRPSYHFGYRVSADVYDPETLSSANWKLASDMYDADESNNGGMSIHADWMNGWHPELMQMLLDNCLKQGLDCHDGNLANGFRLSDTRPGTQEEADVINGGLGE
ncbi:MAG: hypothetical protein ACJAS9_000623 [Polaribacter sp.]|jgi:hypothetical protein